MNIPFTLEQFLETFRNYNVSVFPMQWILALLALICLLAIIRKWGNAGRLIFIILAFFWIWMAVAYHLIHFSDINPAAYGFAALFGLQGLLFLRFAFRKDIAVLDIKDRPGKYLAMVLFAYSLVLYPLTGYVLGHRYPKSPTFGLPCPTTIFTLAILLLYPRKLPVYMVLIPFAWSIIGFTAAIRFGFWEDLGLLLSGILSFPWLMRKKYYGT